jgi:hypothetical protein
VAVLEQTLPETSEAASPPLSYGVALLRIALELKKPGAPGVDEAIRQVSVRMSLDESELRGWLAANTRLLEVLGPRPEAPKLHPMD